MSSSLYRFGAQWRLTVRSHHRCLFFKFFLSPPPSQSISAPSTHGQTQPPSSSPVQDMSMYLMMLMVVVLTTTARSFLAFFYFILIRFLFFYIKDSLVQSSLEQREEKGRGKKAGKTSQSTRSLSKPQAEEVTSFNSFSRCVWCSSFVSAEKETTHRDTHTHARTDAGVGVRLVPVSWLYLTEHFSFFLSQWHTVVLFFYFNFIVLVLSVFNTSDFPFKTLIIVLRCWVLDSNYSGCCCYIISFRVDFIWHYFVLHCCNLHWFKCVLSEL